MSNYLKLTFNDNGQTKEKIKKIAKEQGITVGQFIQQLMVNDPHTVRVFQQKMIIAKADLYTGINFIQNGNLQEGMEKLNLVMEDLRYESEI